LGITESATYWVTSIARTEQKGEEWGKGIPEVGVPKGQRQCGKHLWGKKLDIEKKKGEGNWRAR